MRSCCISRISESSFPLRSSRDAMAAVVRLITTKPARIAKHAVTCEQTSHGSEQPGVGGG
eukprot:2110359-Rhodomonas_salina.5